MASLAKALVRVTIFILAVTTLCTFYYLRRPGNGQFTRSTPFNLPISSPTNGKSTSTSHNPSKSLSLTEQECSKTFPGLTKYIEEAVQKGSFKLSRSSGDYQGLVQGRIKDGKLYIISVAPDIAEQVIYERQAILHQLHRAIITSPESLPDTHFALCINDHPKNNSWVFAQPNKPSSLNTWLMPHFSFWSWPVSHVGTMDEALDRIQEIEESTPWERKIDKIIWRGTAWFNPIGNKNLRPGLLKVSKGKEWADVESLQPSVPNKQGGNLIRIEEFCKYKYVAYTEGVTYSGRLHYHQACASILVTPPLTYLQHTSHLLRPIKSSDLLGFTSPSSHMHNNHQAILPTTTKPHEANAIFVAPDWSDLESVILYLRNNPQLAKGLAERSRDAVIKKNYLSAAAEMCYWRSLIRGWASVVEVDEVGNADGGWRAELGTRFETYALKGTGRGNQRSRVRHFR